MEKSQPFLSVPNAIIVGSVIIAISILISGGVIKFGSKVTRNTQATPAPVAQVPQQPTVTLAQVKETFDKSVIKFGDSNAKLVIIEVADPSCPFCHIAAGQNPALNKQVDSRFTLVSDGGSYIAPVPEFAKLVQEGKAAFAYIYTNGHGNGEMGTKALYCANEKGKFWPAHDLLMTEAGYDLLNNKVKNDKTKSAELANFLQPAMGSASVKQCLDSGKYDSRLQEDSSLASSIGITGTPGFYLNETAFKGANNYTDMEQTVKTALGQ